MKTTILLVLIATSAGCKESASAERSRPASEKPKSRVSTSQKNDADAEPVARDTAVEDDTTDDPAEAVPASPVSSGPIVFGSNAAFHMGDGRFDATSCGGAVFDESLNGRYFTFAFEVLDEEVEITTTIEDVCGIDNPQNIVSFQEKFGRFSNSNPKMVDRPGTPPYKMHTYDGGTSFGFIYLPETQNDEFQTLTLPALKFKKGKHWLLIESTWDLNQDDDDFVFGNITMNATGAVKKGEVKAVFDFKKPRGGLP